MKKIILLFVSVLSLGLVSTSCSKSDSEDSSTSASIVGKWELYQTGEKIGSTESLDLYMHQSGCAKDYAEFKVNGTFETKTYEVACAVSTTSGTYSKSGNSLTTTDEYGPTTVVIKELSSSTLKVYDTYTDGGTTYTDITVLKRMN